MSDKSLINLGDLTYDRLEAFVTAELGMKKFRAGQIWQWIWVRNVADFDAMTDLSQKDRTAIAEKAVIREIKIRLRPSGSAMRQ